MLSYRNKQYRYFDINRGTSRADLKFISYSYLFGHSHGSAGGVKSSVAETSRHSDIISRRVWSWYRERETRTHPDLSEVIRSSRILWYRSPRSTELMSGEVWSVAFAESSLITSYVLYRFSEFFSDFDKECRIFARAFGVVMLNVEACDWWSIFFWDDMFSLHFPVLKYFEITNVKKFHLITVILVLLKGCIRYDCSLWFIKLPNQRQTEQVSRHPSLTSLTAYHLLKIK